MGSKKKNQISRRSLIKAAGIGSLGLMAPKMALSAEECNPDLVDNPTYNPGTGSINGEPILTQTSPGEFGAVALKHNISVHFHSMLAFVNNSTAEETRSFLTVEVGPNPDIGVYYTGNANVFSDIEELTDLYIFDASTGVLLYRREFGGGENTYSTMISLDPNYVAQSRNLQIVVRSSKYGLWGRSFSLGVAPENYATRLSTYDAALNFGGSSVNLPYISRSATGGQGTAENIGDIHRPSINVSGANVILRLGGDANGNGRHPQINESHYIMGGAIFDQSGNLLSTPQTIRYADAVNHQIVFSNVNVANRGTKTIRAVVFDTLNGYLMGWADIA